MILIEKSRRRLTLTRRSKTLAEFKISLGFCPEGHKMREGDGKTPEGDYRICSVNRQSKFCVSLGLNYPSRRDAASACRQKRLSLRDALLLCAADILHLRPKWTTPLGGFIMIHGASPDGRTGDWTQGCIALTNEDIKTLASLCKRGERVRIIK